MHKLTRPQEPPQFTQAVQDFVQTNPPQGETTEGARWGDFRQQKNSAYTTARGALKSNQRKACAYCEMPLRKKNIQIEHFIPKSCTTADADHTLDFTNMLACCLGGTEARNTRAGEYSDDPTARENYSCGETKGNTQPTQCCLNPYDDLPDYPIFEAVLHPSGIAFAPDTAACARAGIAENLVISTIELLNLNCPRLIRRRGEIWRTLAEITEDAEGESVLEDVLFHDSSFYTTKTLYFAENIPTP